MAYEIKHIFDSINCSGPFDVEGSDDDFMIFIWNNLQTPNKFERRKKQ